jgi:ADP-ribose pyrophosphatase YjhB (NUDIX family)
MLFKVPAIHEMAVAMAAIDTSMPVTFPPARAHEKESRNLWIARLLNLDQDTVKSVQFTHGCVLVNGKEVVIPFARRVALFSHHISQQENRKNSSNGAAVLLTNPDHSQVIITQKDDKHPRESCRNMLSLIGGGLFEGEDPTIAVIREVYEEIRCSEVADTIVEKLQHVDAVTLPAVQWPGEYTLNLYKAVAPSVLDFNIWRYSIATTGLSEAGPRFLSTQDAIELTNEEELKPGSTFLASMHRALRQALTHTASSV